MHQIANLNLIRNWVGQSTNEDLYDLCDKYGILFWDEFFQPNPSNGPNPNDVDTYIANVRDKILRFRNHPSIAIWCARNDGFPRQAIQNKIQRPYGGAGAHALATRPVQQFRAGCRLRWPLFIRRTPPAILYHFRRYFKTETGSVSIPTLESIQRHDAGEGLDDD